MTRAVQAPRCNRRRPTSAIATSTTITAPAASETSETTPVAPQSIIVVGGAPWTVISSDTKRARLEAMRHVLGLIDYPVKALDGATDPDPKIVGPAAGAVRDQAAARRHSAATHLIPPVDRGRRDPNHE
jgi:hypothetical protein